jgi:hypothetical protein
MHPQEGETHCMYCENGLFYLDEIKCISCSFARMLGFDERSSTANEHTTLTAARLDDSQAYHEFEWLGMKIECKYQTIQFTYHCYDESFARNNASISLGIYLDKRRHDAQSMTSFTFVCTNSHDPIRQLK